MKGEEKMKRVTTIITLVIAVVMMVSATSTVNASAKSDLKLAKQWAKDRYTEPIKVVDMGKVPKKRKGKVYIERVKTVSDGGYKGHTTKGKYFVRYPKKVKKGKKVTMFFVWNPKNNACDDITCVVCLGIVKGDKIKKLKKTISKVTNKVTSEPEPKEEPIPIETCEHCEAPGKCVYWISNENRHMTPEEIEEFEYLEWHYQNEDGEWVER